MCFHHSLETYTWTIWRMTDMQTRDGLTSQDNFGEDQMGTAEGLE